MNLILLDALVGTSCVDRNIRKTKLKNLEAGLYDDLFVNIEVPNNLEETKFDDLESYFKSLTAYACRLTQLSSRTEKSLSED